MTPSCARGGLGCTSGGVYSWEGWSGLEPARGGLESPHLEVSKELLAMALSAVGWGQGGDGEQFGLDGMGGLFQPKGFWDSVILYQKCVLCPAPVFPVSTESSENFRQEGCKSCPLLLTFVLWLFVHTWQT